MSDTRDGPDDMSREDWERRMENSLGTEITEMDALDLVGRLVVNENGGEFVVTRLSFDARHAGVLIWVAPPDEPDNEAGLMDMKGWSIHQPLRPPRF